MQGTVRNTVFATTRWDIGTMKNNFVLKADLVLAI